MGQYPDEFIDRLHLVWGTGFLSPGRPEEVAAIVQGLDLTDLQVLDIGCGTGGPAMVLARDKGAHVTGIDVEPRLIDRARRLAGETGLAERIAFRLVEPGPLPFSAESFDAVFSKDSLLHIPDKPALDGEVLRALKPGGVFAASDWLAGRGLVYVELEERPRVLKAFEAALAIHPNLTSAAFNAAQLREILHDRDI